jgi:hypothetical protein
MSCLNIAGTQHLFDYGYILFKNEHLVLFKRSKTQEIILAYFLLTRIMNNNLSYVLKSNFIEETF